MNFYKIWLLLFAVFLSFIGVVGDSFLKTAGQGEKFVRPFYFWLGFFTYAITAFGWFYLMKTFNLFSLGAIYAISTVILTTAAGLLIFKETINGWEVVGIFMAVGSVIILARFA